MKKCKTCQRETHAINAYCGWCNKRLEGVQGPEQGLVGDVAKRIPRQGHAEEAKPGERGVGKIGGAVDPLGIYERTLSEARELRELARQAGDVSKLRHFEGSVAALVTLQDRLERAYSQRSDLPNA